MNLQDHQLIERLKAGDSDAFKMVFDRYKEAVITICYRIVDNREEAEDLCQEVFFRVYKSAQTFQHRSQLSTWIYRIAVNLSLNHLRKKKQFRFFWQNPSSNKVQREILDTLPAPAEDQPDILLEQKEKEAVVWKAIASLPRNQRVALILQKYEGFSCQEIAETLDFSLSSVQSLLFRAKENLYKKLTPYLGKK